jgi:hypothetical protein
MLTLPEFLDNRHMKVTKLSALRNGRFYAPGNTPGTNLLRARVDPRAVVRPHRLSQLTIPIEPATFQLVTHCLYQLRHRVPPG